MRQQNLLSLRNLRAFELEAPLLKFVNRFGQPLGCSGHSAESGNLSHPCSPREWVWMNAGCFLLLPTWQPPGDALRAGSAWSILIQSGSS